MSQRNEIAQIITGVLLLVVGHIFAITVLSTLTYLVYILGALTILPIDILLAYAGFWIGISQLLYVIPLVIRLKQLQKWGMMKGVIIGAVITALLNGGCWLLVANSFG